MLPKQIVVTVLLLFLPFTFQAREELFITTGDLTGIQINNNFTNNTNSQIIAQDPQFTYMQNNSNWSDRFTNDSVRGEVYVGIDHDQDNPGTQYNYTVYLSVTYLTYSGGQFISHTIYPRLRINYDPNAHHPFTDKTVLVINDAHKITVTVTDIKDENGASVLPNAEEHIFVGAGGMVERYYKPYPSYFIPNTSIGSIYHATSNQLEVYWPLADSMEAYDLEWTWVDDYDGKGGSLPASQLTLDFAHNSTRVRLTGNSYNIPMIYEQGYVCYRVRPLWKAGNNFEQWVPGEWSSEAFYPPNLVSAYGHKFHIDTTLAHERHLNWQYWISYAEKGKRKEIINYYDGTLRNRQSVTMLNTTGKAIVSETIYDHQGRPAVQILPTPTDTMKIKYFRNFNQSNATQKYYDRSDFDLDNGSCVSSVNPLYSGSGAGHYYSWGIATDSTNTDGAQGYVPDAGGYPFTVTEYTPDNSGRIRRQSGVGANHKLGSNHETKYYYGSPTQEQLDRLFGSDIGYAVHYKKIMTIDPNGQISITYTDLVDKTIATSLAGPAPANLNILDLNTGNDIITIKLIQNNQKKLNSLEVSYPLMVSSTGNYQFQYSMTPEKFQDLCLAAGYCMDCIYELSISVMDECGNEMLPYGAVTRTIGQPDGQCNDPIPLFSINADSLLISQLPAGQYNLVKRLTLSRTALQNYAKAWIDSNTCLKTYMDFFREELDSMDFSGCYIDDCSNGQCDTLTPCEAAYKVMLTDVSPGGQYGLFDFDAGKDSFDASGYPLSVFNTANGLGTDNNWRHPASPYLDENGQPDSVLTPGGKKILPQDLFTLTEFIHYWKPSWAQSLVTYHPEMCYFTWCDNNAASNEYDRLMMKTNRFKDAYDMGLLNPLNMNQSQGAPAIVNSLPYVNVPDPYFQPGGNGAAQYPAMRDTMQIYYDSLGSSIWDVAVWTVSCNGSAQKSINQCISSHPFGQDSCVNDKVWMTFRSLYLSLKLKFQEIARNDSALANNCTNNCIGNPQCAPSPFADKVKRFPSVSEILDLDVWQEGNPILYDSGTGPGVDTVNNRLARHCDSTCAGYADYWMSVLDSCYLYLPGNETWNPGQPTYDAIRQELINVCVTGCDFNNPMGSSTTPPGKTTANGYSSFEQVINTMLGIDSMPDCSADLLTQPMPYGHHYLGNADTGFSSMDTCACNLILNTWNDYNNDPSLPPGTTFSSYFESVNGVSVPLLDGKLCICSDALAMGSGLWTPIATAYLDSLNIWIPFDITCPECISCTNFSDYMAEFQALYPNASLTNNPRLFTGFMNRKLDFNLTAADYSLFKQQCDDYYQNQGRYYTQPLTPEALDIQNLWATLANYNLFCNDTIPIGYLPEFLTSSLNWNFSADPGCWMLFQTWTPLPVYSQNDTVFFPFIQWKIFNTCTQDSAVIEFTYDQNNSSLPGSPSKNVCAWYQNNYNKDNSLIADTTDSQCDNYQFIFQFPNYVFHGMTTSYPMARCSTSPPTLCDEPIFYAAQIDTNDCRRHLINMAMQNARVRYRSYIDSNIAAFKAAYTGFCLANNSEILNLTYPENEYYYTLYYYDRAGNLVKTVPPQGVHPLNSSQLTDAAAYRDSVSKGLNPVKPIRPNHTLYSSYQYTSFNQIRIQNNPDGGTTRFWYDNMGRPVLSQNARQALMQGLPPTTYQTYSYTVYDAFGRITEVGEINAQADPTPAQINDPTFPLSFGSNPHEIIKTFYDMPIAGIALGQQNLRNRVAATAYYSSANQQSYDYATHFSYDAHGNVKKLVQENTNLASLPGDADKKTIEYEYDLVSGNVNEVKYQQGYTDQFYHRYSYDADNRITDVYTSADGIIWDHDANYQYYLHGPLARMELGEHRVQGIDYAYTIQGWIKGVNSNVLNPDMDMGHDGSPGDEYIHGQPGRHRHIAIDAFGYSLSYFADDYHPINQKDVNNPNTYFLASMNNTAFGNAVPDLYNGNIARMVTSLSDTGNVYLPPQGMAYRYDQLNRLVHAEAHQGITNNAWNPSGTALNLYGTDYSYDANGNLLTLQRKGDQSANPDMDALTYHYYSGTNQLEYVDDAVAAATYANDLDDQTAQNYAYDPSGNLAKDQAEEIDTILWTAYGKIKRITRTTGSTKPDLEFAYDASGNRVMKHVIPNNGAPDSYTYYVRDAQGNVMATYTVADDSGTQKQQLLEQYLYGSSRLGTHNEPVWVSPLTSTDTFRTDRVLGHKYYELTNHLGNVLVTITDQKIPQDTDTNDTIDYYLPRVAGVWDYYPFGMQMPGRTISSGAYRYGFNGKETDDEVSGTGNQYDYGFRMYNPRLGRFLCLDPLMKKYPDLSPYHFTGNNPIRFVDFDGQDFGVKVNHKDKTIIIVANVYTTSKKAYEQALKSAGNWNAKSATIDGYTVTFQIKVYKPVSVTELEVVKSFRTVNFYRKNNKLKKRLYAKYKNLYVKGATLQAAEDDPIGNSYSGNYGLLHSNIVSGERFDGGQTANGEHADMNTHTELGDMGAYEDLVTHEFGHFFGLDDLDSDRDGITDPYYPGDGGIMEYKGLNLNPISDDDVKTILNFAKNALSGKTKNTDANVELLENTGHSDGSNPLGVKSK